MACRWPPNPTADKDFGVIACLPMYDWPERRAEVDTLWSQLRPALADHGFEAPHHLTRSDDLERLWLAPDLLVGETCSYPLETELKDRVRYLVTPVHDVPGCGQGIYRSVLIARGLGEDATPPTGPEAALPAHLPQRFAANAPNSMSGYVGLARDCETLGLAMPEPVAWTGSHRASIQAVADGIADYAAIDCVTWQIARQHEPAAQQVHVIGWTAERPGLPLITRLSMPDDELVRLRQAVAAVMPVAVLDQPTER